MKFFNKNESNNDSISDEKKEKIGLVIQITPCIIYLYISYEGYILNDFGHVGLSMTDLDGNYIGIDGNYITLKLRNKEDIQKAKERFGLEQLKIPIIEIPVKEY